VHCSNNQYVGSAEKEKAVAAALFRSENTMLGLPNDNDSTSTSNSHHASPNSGKYSDGNNQGARVSIAPGDVALALQGLKQARGIRDYSDARDSAARLTEGKAVLAFDGAF
jgi:hypothetical protein